MQVEVCDLGAQPRLHLTVHLVAGVHERLGQLHVLSRQAVVGTQSQCPRQKAHQVVLKPRGHLISGSSALRPQTGHGAAGQAPGAPYVQGEASGRTTSKVGGALAAGRGATGSGGSPRAWKERLVAGQGSRRRWGLWGGGPGTPQTSAPPAAVTGHPHPPGTAHTPRPGSQGSPGHPHSQSHQTSSTEAGSPSCLEAGSGKYAPTHHLGAEAAVVELPHKGQLPGLRFSEQVLPDPVHGFQVVFQQPVQTSGACVLWPGGRTALSSTNRG